MCPPPRSCVEDINDSALAFVNQLRANDRLMVMSFSDHVQVLIELTVDREAARRAIKSATQGSATRLFDGIEYANEKLKAIQGRKALVLFTDGIDNGSQVGTAKNTIYTAE